MRMRNGAWGLVLAGLLMAGRVFAAEYDDKWSPAHDETAMSRPGAMGGAFVALAEDNAAAFYNPAGVGLKSIYNLSFEGSLDPATARTMSFGGSILDSISAKPLAVELGYTFQRYDTVAPWKLDADWKKFSNNGKYNTSPQNASLYLNYGANDLPANEDGLARGLMGAYRKGEADRHVVRLSLGGAVSKYFMMGLNVKYAHIERPGRGDLDRVNADLGILIVTDVGLRLGVVGYNLVPWAYQQWPAKLGVGVAYSLPDEFYIDADLITVFNGKAWREKTIDGVATMINTGKDTQGNVHYLADRIVREYDRGTKLVPRVGLEYVILHMVALRGGYEYDGCTEYHTVTGGIGYRGDTYTAGLGYSQTVNHLATRQLMFNFDFQM